MRALFSINWARVIEPGGSLSFWLLAIFRSVLLNWLVDAPLVPEKSSLIQPLALIVHHCLTIWTDRWSSQLSVAFAAVSWILMIIVGIETIIRYCIYVLNTAVITTDPFRFTVPDRLTQRFRDPFMILVGRSIWKGHFM